MSHAPTWRKSSYSVNGTNCVELADAGDTVLVRDSKHPDDGHLTVTSGQLADLLAETKAGRLDHLV